MRLSVNALLLSTALSLIPAGSALAAKPHKLKPAASAKTKAPPPTEPAPEAAAAAPVARGKCKVPARSTCAPNKVLLSAAMTTPYTKNDDVRALQASDVNGDGKDDLVLLLSGGVVQVFISQGEGTFVPGAKVEVNASGYGLIVEDLDGDCLPDILASSFGTESVGNSVSFHAGKGNGQFKPGVFFTTMCSNTVTLFSGDFNGDGKPDFFCDGNGRGAEPTIFTNLGKGKFSTSGMPMTGSGGVFAAGDVTGDDASEFFVASERSNVSQLCVRQNKGNGQYRDDVCYPLSPAHPKAIGIQDINGDGKRDVVVLGDSYQSEPGTLYDVFINKGDGTFKDLVQYSIEPKAAAFRIADINNDGKPDLLGYYAYNNPGVVVLLNKGDGTFNPKPEQYPVGGDSSRSDELLVMGDFNGNGLLGFAVIERLKDMLSVVSASCKP